MWDLETIIRMNNEAFRAAKAKNSLEACIEASIERNERIFSSEKRVFGKTTYVRSVYEGEIDRHPPQEREG